MLGLAEKDIKTAIVTVYHTFKRLNRDMQDIKKYPNWISRDKNFLSEMKITLDGINSRLDTEEKVNEFTNTASAIIQNKTQNEKYILKLILY